MKALRILKYSVLTLGIITLGLFLHYNLPRTDVVQITGTDVKRIDRGESGQMVRTRDVRFISTVTRNGKVKVFRNEDTRWGWPPYFKFNSADITGEAQAFIERPEKPWVRVRYYGWRIRIFSLFPNLVSLKIVDKDYTNFPWFNIIFLTVLVIGIIFLILFARRFVHRLRQSARFQSLSQSVGKKLERPNKS
jgi:hypothetical protein